LVLAIAAPGAASAAAQPIAIKAEVNLDMA
jgi:hypothetical protein